MTGLAAKGSYLYLSSVTQTACYRYDMPNLYAGAYYLFFGGYSNIKDIAINASDQIWVAANHATHTLRLYSTGSMVDFIEPALVPHATGVAMDNEGYLWVADPVNDKLYKIEVTTGIWDETSSGISNFSIRAGANPFAGAVTVFIEGTSNAEVEIFDLHGRLMTAGTATSTFIWDGTAHGTPAPSGTYLALVRGDSGTVQSLFLTKL